ncbi:hypothetical protein Desfe_0522 [Desulfurococcus amylolyticus DSM 16532]|uniref:Uncharacterized protein n=1 Tax=Desulfurococcus amylolyticus DSM 16532 TaxID=768672 RepID=I3XR52_DESAM|nr:hypothetical protein Desfe_0522 [Desulfurococcus amylolyticus DSM 16532]
MLDKILYSKLIIKSLVTRKSLETNRVSVDLIKFAKINKVLYIFGSAQQEDTTFPRMAGAQS